MKVDSLRAEFVLVGLASLAGLYLLMRDQPFEPDAVISMARELSPGGALLTLGLLVAAAYIVGILAVQLTFFIPTGRLVANVRAQRLEELRTYRIELSEPKELLAYQEILSTAFAIDIADTPKSPRRSWRGLTHRALVPLALHKSAFARPTSPTSEFTIGRLRRLEEGKTTATSLALTIGRIEAPDNVTREYEYRRSNRQIFVGCLPALLLCGVAVIRHNVPDRPLIPQIAVTTSAVLATAGVMLVAVHAAYYQEKISQAMLLDVAFLARLEAGLNAANEQSAGGHRTGDDPAHRRSSTWSPRAWMSRHFHRRA